MRIAYSANLIGSNCPEPKQACACGVEDERLHIRCQVTSRPKCITFFGICDDDQLMVVRQLGFPCPVEKPILDCNGDLLKITCDRCEIMLIKPGCYDFFMCDRTEIYEDIGYEEVAIGVEWARLICECGDVNYA